DGVRSRNLGVSCCMTKPVAQSELLNSITTVMGIARADKAQSDIFGSNDSTKIVPKKILLAEDGAVNRKVAVSLLEKRGHDVTAVENGHQAVDAFQAFEFDAILMDVQMPELDGLGATATIRQLEVGSGKRIPIIAITAHAMKGDRQRCLDAGMDAYLSKPFKPRELFASVEDFAAEKTDQLDDRPAPDLSSSASLFTKPPVAKKPMEQTDDRPAADLSGSASMFSNAPSATNNTEATEVRPAPDLSGSASLFGIAPPPTDTTENQPVPAESSDAFDYTTALENVGGSEAVLREVVDLFCVECPKQMADIEAAFASGNKESVMRAAHTFKGSVALFAADAATAAAKRIEAMGRTGSLDDYPNAWDALNVQVNELLESFRALKP
ncbi:MAG: response regulator, partial [Bythopirellula sp.]